MQILDGLDAVHDRHFQVHDQYVWLKLLDQVDGFLSITGLANQANIVCLPK